MYYEWQEAVFYDAILSLNGKVGMFTLSELTGKCTIWEILLDCQLVEKKWTLVLLSIFNTL